MNIDRRTVTAQGIRFSISNDGQEIARAYLYMMHNDLHSRPFGLLEDVFVEETERGSGSGTTLVNEVIATAREQGCYKLIATSRHARARVHELYNNLGFQDHGKEFRIDFDG